MTTEIRSATSLRDRLPGVEAMFAGLCVAALGIWVAVDPTLQENLTTNRSSQLAAVVGVGLVVLWQWAKQSCQDALIRVMTVIGPAGAILVLQAIRYPIAGGVYLYGIVLGLLGALVALGMALIYRANRILNFAQGDLGLVPTVLALDLVAYSGLPYLAGLFLGLGAAIILGIVVEFFIIRRFFKAPRLILTVATIGLAQLLTVGALLIPMMWGKDPVSQNPSEPFSFTFEVSPITFHASALLAIVVAPLCIAAIAVFLRYTAVGMAVRASAERSDRASLLGIPVKRLQTVVWVMATVLSFIAVFMKAGLVGLPFASNAGFGTTSFGALLAALTALMLGRMTNLPSVAISAVALGVLEQATIWWNSDNPAFIYPIYGAVVLIALILRKTGQSRTEHDATASWQAADEVRPIPRELRKVPEVAALKWGGLLVIGLLLVKLPSFGFMGTGEMIKASAVVVFAIVGISIIMLTGWAGQVSLGQMAFVGFGAAVGALATREWNLDLSLALIVAGLAGSVVAIIVGLPALRVKGLFLAVTTLAFAVTASNYLLDPKKFGWIPTKRIDRRPLFGRIDLESQTNMYYLCLAVLLLAILAVTGLRRSRTGRVLLALRENERGAQAYGINITRAKLLAFALSGFLAAVAGGLFVHVTSQFSAAEFGAGPSFAVFTSTVVGGLGSITGGILGAVFSRGGTWFLKDNWQLLPSAIGVLLVLLIFPGGLSGLLFRLRDLWLRSVARRFDIIVPSLLADVRQEDPAALEHAEEAAEEHDHLVTEHGPAEASAADDATGREPAMAATAPSSVEAPRQPGDDSGRGRPEVSPGWGPGDRPGDRPPAGGGAGGAP
ncbi:MAG: ABC transporter permease [Actinobacteria bacterium]|nr:ABC transporter permease [Actinomycetota bacterium]